jgi:hypothetical protein
MIIRRILRSQLRPGSDRHGAVFLALERSAGQDSHQSEYRLAGAPRSTSAFAAEAWLMIQRPFSKKNDGHKNTRED